MRIIITGSRFRESANDYVDVNGALNEFAPQGDVTIVAGGCETGIDKVAKLIATHQKEEFNVKYEEHAADWTAYGKAAGPMRNEEMAKAGADICLAFPDIDSAGTIDMIKCAIMYGIKTVVYPKK